jgi:hypothetical protein
MKGHIAATLSLAAAMAALPIVAVSQSDHSREELSDRSADALLAGREMPEVFGGLWLDEMTVVAAFTDDATANQIDRVIKALPGWAKYRIEEVDYSEARLSQVKEDVSAAARGGELDGVIAINPDVVINAVEIGVRPERIAEMEGRLRESYGDRARLVIYATEPDRGAACTRYDCWDPPFKGGLSIDGCTSTGVVFRHNGGSSYSFRLLTAGHCTQTGAGWTHDGHDIGATTSTRYHNDSECDCQIIELPADWEGHRYLKNDNQGANFLYRKQRSAMLKDTPICQSGKMAPNRRCGEVTDVDYDSYREDDGLWLRRMAIANFDVEHGDSGGPVTSNSGDTAWGLISGIQDDGDAVFSPIEGTEIEWTDPGWKLCVSEDSVTEC